MPDRPRLLLTLLTTISLLALPVSVSAVQQPRRPTGTDAKPAGTGNPAVGGAHPPKTPADDDFSVEEAIRLAIEALEYLEAGEETDTTETVLESANRYIEIVRTNEPANPSLPFLLGRVYAVAGRRGDAVDQLRGFVDTSVGRNEWRAYRILGDLFLGEYPRLAKGNYEKAAALNPKEPSVLFGLSACAVKLGATDEAIRLAEETVAADGKRSNGFVDRLESRSHIRYVSHLARLFKAVRRWEDAVREAERALDLAKKKVEARPGVLTPLKGVDAQYALLNEILQARLALPEEESPKDYLRLAESIRERVRITRLLALHDVLHWLEAGVNKTSPGTPPALLEQYGIVLAEVGRPEVAVGVFERLLASDPSNSVATEWLIRLQKSPTGVDSDTPEQSTDLGDSPG